MCLHSRAPGLTKLKRKWFPRDSRMSLSSKNSASCGAWGFCREHWNAPCPAPNLGAIIIRIRFGGQKIEYCMAILRRPEEEYSTGMYSGFYKISSCETPLKHKCHTRHRKKKPARWHIPMPQCMYVCRHIYIYMYIYIYVYIYTYIYVCACITYMYSCRCMYHLCRQWRVCMHRCAYVCMYTDLEFIDLCVHRHKDHSKQAIKTARVSESL